MEITRFRFSGDSTVEFFYKTGILNIIVCVYSVYLVCDSAVIVTLLEVKP